MTQPGLALVNRSCTVTVGTIEIANIGGQIGLDVWFQVRRSLKPKEPNTCDLRIYGLSEDTQRAIEQSAQPHPSPASAPGAPNAIVPVKIVAGYVGATATIFLGEMRSAQTVTDGPDTVTELTTGDGDQAGILARSTASFGAGANAYTVAQQLLADMKCGVGNLQTVAQILRASPLYQKAGVVLKGNSKDMLDDLARSCGLEVTTQNGIAQWHSLGQPLGGEAYSLSSDTGLIGVPSVDTKGVLCCDALMMPGIRPGIPIVMNAGRIKGLYRVISVETTGGTADNDWHHKVEAKRYGLAP
jgi:hypothetical protein